MILTLSLLLQWLFFLQWLLNGDFTHLLFGILLLRKSFCYFALIQSVETYGFLLYSVDWNPIELFWATFFPDLANGGPSKLISESLWCAITISLGFPGGSDGKESACNESSIPGMGRSPGEGNGNPLQYSCLKNSMDKGAWWVIEHRVAKSWTRLSN